ncbi:MAG: TIGR00159 family protein [Deltaproteobacteria bacterium]|nr:TIGR00159 family protein [Deltaproteobacteria bacterium]
MPQFIFNLRWQDALDILLVAVIIYQVFLMLRGTQAIWVLAGLFLVFLSYLTARRLELFTLEWLLDGVVKSFFLIIIILFQADIRRVLSRMGRKAFVPTGAAEPVVAEEICEAAETLASHRIGGLIVLERQVGLTDYLEGAIRLDALITWELLVSLFWPHNPTHDGAVIIHGDRVIAAGCVLPLSKNPELDPVLGTRHRAAVGITENSDALALVVSETNGQISLARGGRLIRNLTRLQLRQELHDIFENQTRKGRTLIDRLARLLGTS